ncbi:unnamed protein product [Ranitomeya imitator]|uniref:Ku C-terminal domain-containing protein n=1 Tax=Ranitomeya imitator TaxID=111125 RepID=A0ABN9KXY3_9NEOB|nr:unnamed protein product [Ranitomeya imitator]
MKTEDEDFSVSQVADANVTGRQKNANFQNLSKQLVKRIYEFLDIKQSQYYMKSMSCIKCFREEAVRMSHAPDFNDFLQSLKERTASNVFREFWEIVVQGGSGDSERGDTKYA